MFATLLSLMACAADAPAPRTPEETRTRVVTFMRGEPFDLSARAAEIVRVSDCYRQVDAPRGPAAPGRTLTSPPETPTLAFIDQLIGLDMDLVEYLLGETSQGYSSYGVFGAWIVADYPSSRLTVTYEWYRATKVEVRRW
jgi:hypothetical protein